MIQLKISGLPPLDDRHWERKRSAEWDEPLPYFMQVGFELDGVEECVNRHFQNLLEFEGMEQLRNFHISPLDDWRLR